MGGKKRVSKKYIKYQYFKVRWMKKEKIMRTRNNMRSKNHTFDTIKQNMTSLSFYNDEGYFSGSGIFSLQCEH